MEERNHEQMQKKISGYILSIKMPVNFEPRFLASYRDCQELCPEQITDTFVSEYIAEDGSKEYEDLWFLSEQYIM